MDHSSILSILDFVIESIDKFIDTHQEHHLTVSFQYLEHFQSSDHNFMNVNSINNDCENHLYIFKINKQYFQFTMHDVSNMIISARSLITTLRNARLFLIDIKNKKECYTFSYTQDLIISSFNNVIKKYVALHKFLKIIEKKSITMADAELD